MSIYLKVVQPLKMKLRKKGLEKFEKSIVDQFLDFKPITSIGGNSLKTALDYAQKNKISFKIVALYSESLLPMLGIERLKDGQG